MPGNNVASVDPRHTTPDDLDPAYLKIRDLIYQTTGIYHPKEKLYLLASRCARRMSAIGATTAAVYLEHLTTFGKREDEMRMLLNEITIGETCMFRSPPQLEALRNSVLPQILQNKGKLGFKTIRIWSAGCSTGEEAYSLAIVLGEESQKLLKGWRFEILATDLNEKSLERAKAGIYGEYALRNTDALLKKKYFKPHGSVKLQVNDDLKAMIRFERVNLSDDSRMLFLKGMDIIFCCNVLIYFDVASKRRVVQHFFSNLLPGGYLFLGHAESLYQIDEAFQLTQFSRVTAYWKPSIGHVAANRPR